MSRMDKRVWRDSSEQYRIHKGIARVAKKIKAGESDGRDPHGVPLRFASGVANGFSMKAIERMEKGRTTQAFLIPDNAYAHGYDQIDWDE